MQVKTCVPFALRYIEIMKNGKDNKNAKEKIVKFPTLGERDRIRKQQSYKPKAQKAAAEPFFNFGAIPQTTKILAIAMVAIHAILTIILGAPEHLKAIYMLGFIPGAFTGNYDYNWWAPLTPLTYNFVHGSWPDVILNAIMIFALGTFLERMMGAKAFIKFFLLCGVGGAAVYFLLNTLTNAPIIGSSTATGGMFAAAIMMLYEQGRFGALTGKLAGKGPWPIIGIWVGIMLLFGIIFGGNQWPAHIGGYLTGSLLYTLMRKGKLRL